MTVFAKVLLSIQLFFIVGIAIQPLLCQVQSVSQDSILSEINQITSDSAKIAWALEQSRKSNLELAAIYVNKGIELATQNKDLKSLAEFYTEKAINHNRSGRLSQGLISFKSMDSISRILQDTNKIAAAQTNIGLTHYYLGNLDQALNHYFYAYQLHQNLNNPKTLSRLLNNLAIANKKANNYTLAQKFYHESFEIKQELRDSNGMATTLMNLGLLLSEIKEVDAAIDTLQLSRNLFQKLNAHQDAMGCQLSLAKVMIDHKQLERALPLVKESYDYFHNNFPESREKMLASGDLATIYAANKNWALANNYVKEAVDLSKRSKRSDFQQSMLKLESEIKYALKNYKGGYESLQASYEINDRINNEARIELVEEMQARFDLDLKQKEIELLNTKSSLDEAKLNTAKNKNVGLMVIGIIFVLFSIFLYRLYLQVNSQKNIIAQALKDKDSLLKEIHHRVKNNLQVISSLLSMQSFQIEDEYALQAVKESQNRVKSMALIHQNLYNDTDLTSIDSADYFRNLTQSLFDSYNIDENRISFKMEIESVPLDVDVMIPMGLILNELISNALKYAFPDGQVGSIEVGFSRVNGQLILQVNDDGVGLPAEFNQQELHSMGYQLIKDFTRKLNGDLQIKTDKGTSVSLLIPQSKLVA